MPICLAQRHSSGYISLFVRVLEVFHTRHSPGTVFRVPGTATVAKRKLPSRNEGSLGLFRECWLAFVRQTDAVIASSLFAVDSSPIYFYVEGLLYTVS